MAHATLDVLEKITDGAVSGLLAELVAEGLSADRMSRQIEDRFGVVVGREAVRRWVATNITVERAAS